MSPDHGSSRSRRGVWSHWVPLAVTLTVATVGVAAWVWSQRKDEDEEAEHVSGLDYANADYGADNRAQGSRDIGPEKPPRPDEQSQGIAPGEEEVAGSGWGFRGALRRTPSPQQFFDSTGKTVAAGVAAASAAMGKALASIREEDKSPYSGESNPWSEEADAKEEQERQPPAPASPSAISGGKKRKTVAIVVSADAQSSFEDEDGFHEHAVSAIDKRHDTYVPY